MVGILSFLKREHNQGLETHTFVAVFTCRTQPNDYFLCEAVDISMTDLVIARGSELRSMYIEHGDTVLLENCCQEIHCALWIT